MNFKTDSINIANIILDNFKDKLLFNNSIFYYLYRFIAVTKPVFTIFEKVHALLSKLWETFIWADNENVIFCLSVQRINLFKNRNWLLCNAAFNKLYSLDNLAIISRIRTIVKMAINHVNNNGGKYLFADIQLNKKVPYLFCKNINFKFYKLIIYYRYNSCYLRNKSRKLNKITFWKIFFYSINSTIIQLNRFKYKSLKFELQNKKNIFFIKNNLYEFDIYNSRKKIGIINLDTSKFLSRVVINLELNEDSKGLIEEEFFKKIFQILCNSFKNIVININREDDSIIQSLLKLKSEENYFFRRLILTLD